MNCQRLFDEKIKSGTEIYSRLFKVPVEEKIDKVIKTYIPEVSTYDDEVTPYYNEINQLNFGVIKSDHNENIHRETKFFSYS